MRVGQNISDKGNRTVGKKKKRERWNSIDLMFDFAWVPRSSSQKLY